MVNKRKNFLILLGSILLIILASSFFLNFGVNVVRKDKNVSDTDTSKKCILNSDCIIKELQDCGGTYRTCVNKNYEQDLEFLNNSCKESENKDQGPGLAKPLWMGPEFVGCDCKKFECTNVFSFE